MSNVDDTTQVILLHYLTIWLNFHKTLWIFPRSQLSLLCIQKISIKNIVNHGRSIKILKQTDKDLEAVTMN
jgi:hypothetical protein